MALHRSRRLALDSAEYLLDTDFHPETILGSDSPYGWPHTGRQFSNDEVYLANGKQYELHRGETTIQAIIHFARMRHDRARQQLAVLRRQHPRGSSGARFPVDVEPPPP